MVLVYTEALVSYMIMPLQTLDIWTNYKTYKMKGFHIIQISLCDSSLVLSIVRKTCNNIWNLFKNKLGLKKKIYDRVNQIYIVTSLLYPRLFCGERDLTTYPLILFFYFVLRISEIVIIWEMTSFHLLNTSRH